ncbi:MAG: hypothetical protein ABRQ24_08670 [Syntrophomonadaceae bacterium]
MRQDISLWCPVIVAGPPGPGTCRKEERYSLGERYQKIDDIRIKTQRAGAVRQGKYVQAVIQLEAVILVEDRNGHTGVLSRLVYINKRVEWPGMDKNLLNDDGIMFILHIESLQWDAEFMDGEIVMRYTIDYTVHAVREQAVRIHLDQDEWEPTVIPDNRDGEASEEMSRIRNENRALNRRLGFYQKDVLSLQHGIKKVEERNAQLCRELDGTREKVQQLQEAVTRKDLLISRQNSLNNRPDKMIPHSPKDEEGRLGQRIKRLLLNCL